MGEFKLQFHQKQLTPCVIEGQLAGLTVDGALIPRPCVGLETELGNALPGGSGQVHRAVADVLARRTGIAANGSATGSSLESERQFHPFGSTYLELDKIECNTWLHPSAQAAHANMRWLFDELDTTVQAVGTQLVLHATGADGQGHSWSSLHVNVPLSDLTYTRLLAEQRAGWIAYHWYLPAQLTLAVVDGNGGIGTKGFLVSDRIGAFDRVFGMGTMTPSRALVVDRPEGFGCRRFMHMLRAWSFAPAGPVGLVATQLDTLICEFLVHGVMSIHGPPMHDPVAAGQHFARHEHRKEAARLQARVQVVRHRVVDWLVRRLGTELIHKLLPDVTTALQFLDATLRAVEQDDEAELVQRCEWARKLVLVRAVTQSRQEQWDALRSQLLELNVHYARLDQRALRHHELFRDPPPADPRPVPTETSSWFLHALVARAQRDPAFRAELQAAELSWHGVSTGTAGWRNPWGAWPWAERHVGELRLVPWRFCAATHSELVAKARSLAELVAAAGEASTVFGDAMGRTYRTGAGAGPAPALSTSSAWKHSQ